MESLPKTIHLCDQCGRSMQKVHRRYRGETYCTTCYYREFKHGLCPCCGNRARLHRKYPKAVCLKCENAGKPCIRCGETEFVIGKIVDDGPVCNSCSVHFRPPRKCTYCGVTSKYLARDFKAGFDEPACPKCRRKNHATCSVCRRHRICMTTETGQTICKNCQNLGETVCAECQAPVPAGYGSRCEMCSLKLRLNKAIDKHCAEFTIPEIAPLYKRFCAWLVDESGLKKSTSAVYRYHVFFLEIETIIFAPVTYEMLLAKYGADGLRRWMMPVGFLIEHFGLEINENEKLDNSERRRIITLMKKLPDASQSKRLLDAYYQSLLGKIDEGETTIKSVRLALTPAVDLLKSVGVDDAPTQYHLNIYLRKKPGQRAAISGFVGFMKSQYQVDWELPKKATKSKIYARQEAEIKLVNLLRNPKSNEIYRQRLLRTQLLYFHGLDVKSNSIKSDINDAGVRYVEYSGKRYWLPD